MLLGSRISVQQRGSRRIAMPDRSQMSTLVDCQIWACLERSGGSEGSASILQLYAFPACRKVGLRVGLKDGGERGPPRQGPTKHQTDLDSGGTFKIASCAHDARPVQRQLDHHCNRVLESSERSGARLFSTHKSFMCNLVSNNALSNYR